MKELMYIWFARLNVRVRLKNELLKKFESLENFFNASLDDLVYFDVSDKDIEKILDVNLRRNLIKEYEILNKNNIGVLAFEDKIYPKRLLNIDDFPKVIFYKGDISILNSYGIGIVGSRIATKKSLEKTRKIAREISSFGINVISGLAKGIDKYAHLGSLDENYGKTIAVLGSGLDDKSFYPYENKKVYERIIENGGCVLSEFPIGTKPYSYNFPYRNRIISGLSEMIIVVQASLKSGSLITVDYALEQGKDVYVVKPEKEDEYFLGNIELINQGAKIYKNIENILENGL